MRRKLLLAAMLVGLGLLAVLAIGWLDFRYSYKSWAWWQPPARLTLYHGRHYWVGTPSPQSKEQAGVDSSWYQLGHEWPMRWTIWSPSPSSADAPTVVFLRTGANTYVGYSLSGGG